jgi:hypothetical protein
VAPAAGFLLSHLSLLFVPVGVGVMTHLALLSAHGLQLVAVIVLSTWVGMAVTAQGCCVFCSPRRKTMQNFVELWVYLSSAPAVRPDGHAGGVCAGTGAVTALPASPLGQSGAVSVVVLATCCWPPARRTPPTLPARSSSTFCSAPPSWRWAGRCGSAAPCARAGGRLVLAALAGARQRRQRRGLGWALGLPTDVLMSLAPKSVTAPVAMGIAEQIGGVPALAAVFAVLTGMVGALRPLAVQPADAPAHRRRRHAARLCAGHRIARHWRGPRMQVHADAGAYAGLALGLQVVLARC